VQLIPHNSLSGIINIVAIYGLWKSSEIVYYQITQCLNKDITSAPYLHCNILVRIIINNYCVEYLYCIFKFVSLSFITVYKNFRFLVQLWANKNNNLAIPTGNTILKRQQCDVCTLCLCYDSGNARNRFQRSARVHIYAFVCSMPFISQCYYSIQ
jgi:hypothetical protein